MRNSSCEASAIPGWRVHATSALPVWLWSIDGTRILWANPVGARLFGAANGAVLAGRIFGPADQHRRQVAQLAGRLSPTGAIRLERLRGFGAPLGILMTCGCARLEFADGNHGVLIAAAEAIGPRDAADRTAAAPGRRHRYADRGVRARRHVRRRQRRRAAAARLSQSLRGRSRRGAQRRARPRPRRDAGRHRPHGAAARRHRRGCRAGGADRAGAGSAVTPASRPECPITSSRRSRTQLPPGSR